MRDSDSRWKPTEASGRSDGMPTGQLLPGSSSAVWLAARLVALLFYRVQRIGPAIPSGPVIVIANHPNSLLDPALVQATAGRPVRFLAKSTLFHGHLVSTLVRHSGAIPVYRRIDPGVDTGRNVEAFGAVAAALARSEVIAVFPEGISHSTGRLEPLRTGAARMALASLAAGVRVQLVPVALNFHHLVSFRSKAIVSYGAAFACADLDIQYRESPSKAVRILTDRIAQHLRELLVEADPRTELKLVERIDRLYSAARGVLRTPEATVERRQLIANGLHRLKTADPEQLRMLYEKVAEYDARLARVGLRDYDVDRRVETRVAIRFALREIVYALVLAPLAICGLLLFWIPYGVTSIIGRQPDSLEVRATWKAIGGTFVYGLWIVGIAALAWLLYGVLVGLTVLCALPGAAIAALLAFEREVAVLRIVRAFFAVRQTPAVARARLARQRNNIATVLESVERWLERQDSSS